MELDRIYNEDCLEGLKGLPDNSVDLVLTDIPYGEVSRESNGLYDLDYGAADVANFDLTELTQILCKKTKGSIYMFCGIGQLSYIRNVMVELCLSTRVIVWEKKTVNPMNGEHIWLSGLELCVFGKKPGATFNLHCKNSILRFPSGERKIHPTQKPLDLFRYLIMASSNEGDVVLDPFMGSGTTAVACIIEKRHFIGFELNKEYFDKAAERVRIEQGNLRLF